ncbi:MAG TPA: sugar kinase [Gaiellales bacterium]|nr:sugar kinase [Gaiellales bacterium]
MRDIDLLVVGDCNPDLVLTGDRLRPCFGQGESWVDRAELVIGGTSSITACGAARLGLRTAMAAVVGDDLFGRFMLDQLAVRGVDTTAAKVDPRAPTGLSTVLVEPGDRATLTFRGTIGELTGGLVSDELLARCRHVHTGGWFLQGAAAELADVLRRARAAGATTSLDPGADPDGGWDGGLKALLPEIDQLLPNAAEACALAGTEDVERAARRLAGGRRTVVVKCGADGVLAVVGGTVVRAPALATDVVDTIGAGDSTNAGWLAGLLQGWPVDRCARLAAVCGSLSTRGLGGTASQPTMEEALVSL